MTALAIVLIGFGLILGVFTRDQAFRKLGRILIFVALTPILIGAGKSYFYQLPVAQKIILASIMLPVGIFIALRILLGRDIFNDVMGRFIYDALRFVITLPFRIISLLIQRFR